MDALIGFSGFVGGTLLRQAAFEHLYRSTNIGEIENRHFDVVVCAGAPAKKWIANKDPEGDLQKIEMLIARLKTISCKMFILISTVDVFKQPFGVDEDSIVAEEGLHAYGLHRRMLEVFVQDNFTNNLVVRLPGLVGPGLQKNVIFDFLNNNNVSSIDSRGVFQFYPMVNLWYDVHCALKAGLKLVHLTSEPISVSDISLLGFGQFFSNQLSPAPAEYDFQSKHAEVFGGSGRYQYSHRETVQAIRFYAQSEPLKAKGGAL
ncbi:MULTISPECIES: NAD(P)-dependent oxidoreductase [Pseudomonas]|uniref:Pyridine nucleotide transhydrogenase n=1 Tax=Pseudomonas azadiae TaxID=2843612 RepID=A0ABS6P234_9PSED|nr:MULTISPECIES: NAD(P)-dependent oxidoreductase [Pseudomonas]MBV4454529.1 pyridine nucleotide transhydrogenase [Pseudomonas azadiae]NMF39671.1 NAD(P)-dependent oxidoreductase [Pseudomonas sp. SWRI 103]